MVFWLFPKYFSMCFFKNEGVLFYIIPVQVASLKRNIGIILLLLWQPLTAISFITTTIKTQCLRYCKSRSTQFRTHISHVYVLSLSSSTWDTSSALHCFLTLTFLKGTGKWSALHWSHLISSCD